LASPKGPARCDRRKRKPMDTGRSRRWLSCLLPDSLHVQRLCINLAHFHVACGTRTHGSAPVEQFELQWPIGWRLQPVIDKNTGGRICFLWLLMWHGRAVYSSRHHGECFTGLEEVDICGADFRRLAGNLAQRRHLIYNPKSSPMCRNDEVITMDDNVSDRRNRHVVLQWSPMVTVIKRHIYAQLCRSIEDAFRLRVLFHAVDIRAFRYTRYDVLLCLARVVSAVDVRLVIRDAVAIHGGVRTVELEVACFYLRDLAPGREFFRSNVAPVLAIVSCEVNGSVVSANPNRVAGER
jgi:hypothetical protein